MRNRLTIVISGPSGVGKGTICSRLLEDMKDLALSISCTTRAPRPRKDGSMEENGVEYNFLTEEEFSRRVSEGDFLEHAGVHGKRYGTSRDFVNRMKAAGKDVMLEIDMQGALQVKAADPDAVTIFILPPDFNTLQARLLGRNSETDEQVAKRLRDAKDQLPYAYAYDFVVVNDDLDTAVGEVEEIIRSCAHLKSMRKALIDETIESFQGK